MGCPCGSWLWSLLRWFRNATPKSKPNRNLWWRGKPPVSRTFAEIKKTVACLSTKGSLGGFWKMVGFHLLLTWDGSNWCYSAVSFLMGESKTRMTQHGFSCEINFKEIMESCFFPYMVSPAELFSVSMLSLCVIYNHPETGRRKHMVVSTHRKTLTPCPDVRN